MWLIAGLGNPGRKYERNRHNIGFRVADELVRRHDMGAFRERFGGDAVSGAIGAGGRLHKVIVLKPLQYMNRSGFAVQQWAQFHDIAPESIIVLHDEIDIDFGRLKLKSGGGHGGHNGLRSIIQQLGSDTFLRVRVGVGKPGPPTAEGIQVPQGAKTSAKDRDARVAGYVLSDFPSAQDAAVADLIRRAADATEAIVAEGILAAMNKFNTKD